MREKLITPLLRSCRGSINFSSSALRCHIAPSSMFILTKTSPLLQCPYNSAKTKSCHRRLSSKADDRFPSKANVGSGVDDAQTPLSSKDHHALFEEQIHEMDAERGALFGSTNDENGADDAPTPLSSKEQHALFDEQLHEMHAERAALFGFTDNEKDAWGAAGGSSHSHSAEFMDLLDMARSSRNVADDDTGGKGSLGLQQVDDSDVGGVSFAEPIAPPPPQSPQAFESKTVSNARAEGFSPERQSFTHLTPTGDDVSMVDVGEKAVTRRVARARSVVVFPPEVMDALGIDGQGRELVGPKGPIFATAKLAGIMGAKRTQDLIPLCHPLPLDRVHVDIRLEGNEAIVECECSVTHKTGVEMEALTGASVAALTIYDMVKAVSHKVRIDGTALISKTGGKRDVRQ